MQVVKPLYDTSDRFPLTDIPIQTKVPQDVRMNSLESQTMDKEVKDMLAKGWQEEHYFQRDTSEQHGARWRGLAC